MTPAAAGRPGWPRRRIEALPTRDIYEAMGSTPGGLSTAEAALRLVATGRNEHSHLGSPLVDIVGGPRITPETIDLLRRYVVSLGAVPLVLERENPGYVDRAPETARRRGPLRRQDSQRFLHLPGPRVRPPRIPATG